MRLFVARNGYGGPNDVMTYAALARVNRWDVRYFRTPPLTSAEAPGVRHAPMPKHPFLLVEEETIGMEDGDTVEPAELGYDWTKAICDMSDRCFPTVWQNLPYVDTTARTPTILGKARGFIARSNMTCELLRLYGVGDDRIHLCHAAVDAERFTPPEPPPSDRLLCRHGHEHATRGTALRCGLQEESEAFAPARAVEVSDERIRILFAGRPVAEKGISDLIWALLALPAELREKVTLVLAGVSTLDVPGLKTEALGPVPHHRMPAVYQSCDAFVYATWPTPEWLEQWGLSVVEAMSCGLPVVTTDVGAFREILPPQQHSHWMVPARDWVSLRDRLAQLVENASLRRTLGKHNRAHVVEHFDGRKTAAQYAKAFEVSV